jgi:hypothetical protein
MDGFPLTRCVKGIRIRRFNMIRKSRRIRTQPLFGKHPSWVPYLFLGMSKGFD